MKVYFTMPQKYFLKILWYAITILIIYIDKYLTLDDDWTGQMEILDITGQMSAKHDFHLVLKK